MEHSFSGSALSAVEADGSVRLPRFVLAALARRSDSAMLMMAPHRSDACLVGYDRGHTRFLYADEERVRLSPGGADGHDSRARRIFGWIEESSYAPDGRILLPAPMRQRGGLDDLALFVGAGPIFEIWNPRIALDSGDRALSEIAEWRFSQPLTPAQ